MGLIYNPGLTNDYKLGVWEINESISELIELSELISLDHSSIKTYKFEQRKKQFLVSQLLIHGLSGEKWYGQHNQYGAPILDGKVKVSLSHSKNMVAAICHPTTNVGVDIELIHSKIDRVKNKFLGNEEVSTLGNNPNNDLLHYYWGAKEAMFKFYQKGELLFSKHLFVHPIKLNESGSGTCEIIKENRIKLTTVYKKINGYMLVYVTNV